MVYSVDLLCPVGARVSLIRKSGPTSGSMSSGCWLRGPPPSTGSPFLRTTLWHPQCLPHPSFSAGTSFESPSRRFLPPLPQGSRGLGSKQGGREDIQEEAPPFRSRQGDGLSFCLTTRFSHQIESVPGLGEPNLRVPSMNGWT